MPDVAAATFGRVVRAQPPEVLRVLQVAAVADGDLAVVGRVCAAEGLAEADLERAESSGLVVVNGDRFEFTHPLARAAVYADAPLALRRRLHRRVAEALPPGDLDRRAWHLSAAAIGPDEQVAGELDGVGARASARGAFAVAVDAHERAARLSESHDDRARRFLTAGEAAWHAGADARATALLDQAIRHDRTPSGQARARAITGLVAARGGSLVQARDLLRDAAVGAGRLATDEALLLEAEVVEVCFYLLDAAGAAEAADRAERLLATRPIGASLDRSAAIASIAVGMARIFAGGPGAEPIRRGVDALTAASAPDLPSAWEVIGQLYLRESGTGRELVVQALDQRRRASSLGTLPHLLFHLARNDATTDRWSRAEASYGEAIALSREFGQATELGASLAGLTWLLGRQGRADECRAAAAEAAEVAAGRQLHVVTAWVGFALAELDLSLGEVAAAIVGFDRLAALLSEHGVLDPDLSPVPELVEALVRTGAEARAREVAAPYLELARRKGLPWSAARASRVRALLAPDDQADELFAAALGQHAVTPDHFEAARTRLLYGERLRRLRRRVDAREHLGPALAEFERLGARRWSDRALAELQATGLTARRREAGPVVELTPRELQIGLLLADGRTTREVAAALFLSPKTVEYHLRHVYTKLGIGSRGELTERLRDRDD